MKKLLVFDMDNVICDLQTVWLRFYNMKYGDNAVKEQILEYDIHNYVKYGHAIYEFINNPEIFRILFPLPPCS